MFAGKARSLPKSGTLEIALLGKALALPPNIRLGWKSLPGDKYYGQLKTFINHLRKKVLHTWPQNK
jgi:hypothetical protein